MCNLTILDVGVYDEGKYLCQVNTATDSTGESVSELLVHGKNFPEFQYPLFHEKHHIINIFCN